MMGAPRTDREEMFRLQRELETARAEIVRLKTLTETQRAFANALVEAGEFTTEQIVKAAMGAVYPASCDRSGEAGETPKSGSTEGESAVLPEEAGDAQPSGGQS